MSGSRYQGDEYENAIAVVGMAGTFCDAPTLDALWSNLKSGYEAVRFLDRNTLRSNGCPDSMLAHPMFVPATAMMRDVDRFDADFFGFTPAEARLMDPQLRLMLQTAWHAFEDANFDPGRMPGLTGVFAGGHRSDYLLCSMGPEYSIQTGMRALTASLFNGQDYLSTWISYKLGLTGPSLNVQTACSTGLVAVATACQNLLDYSCDVALAIAGAVFSPRDWGYLAETGSILSADGHCRPYDVAAGGTITGEGVAAVVLKRLCDALEDNDSIFGIIRGYAVNNDGALRAGYAAPSVAGQEALLTQALASAGLDSGQVTYIEGHGTGTRLGDPIEFKALQSVFGRDSRTSPCYLGSVKANLGHLGVCAGMVGLQKALLMLGHGILPPQINFDAPNPEMGMEGSAFQVCTALRQWPEGSSRIAGVSSFGLGGTNCHMVVEGVDGAFAQHAGLSSPRSPLAGYCPPICLSARSEAALAGLCGAWSAFLQSTPHLPVATAAASVLAGRSHMPWRVAVTADTPAEAARKLQSGVGVGRVAPAFQEGKTVLFVQDYVGRDIALCRGLFRDAEACTRAFMACAELCAPAQGADILDTLRGDRELAGAADRGCLEPILGFAAAIGLGHLLCAAGVRLDLAAGHGAGALAVKVLSGAMSLAEGVWRICGRADSRWPGHGGEASGWDLPGIGLVAAPSGGDCGCETLITLCRGEGARFFLAAGEPCAPQNPEGAAHVEDSPVWIRLGTPEASPPGQLHGGTLQHAFADVLAALFRAGASVLPRPSRRVRTPLYPFERNSYWPEPGVSFCDMLRSPGEPATRWASSADGPDDAPGGAQAAQREQPRQDVSAERRMCDIWNAALGIDDIALDDDFFARGGTSLSAIAIVADIEKCTGLTIELRELLRLRSIGNVIGRLSEMVEDEGRGHDEGV